MLIVANYEAAASNPFASPAMAASVNPPALCSPPVRASIPSGKPSARAPGSHLPDNYFIFVPDLGLDKILFFRFDAARAILWRTLPRSST